MILENIKIALRSVKSQLLRTILTVMIITVGITALVGILTAIDSIKAAINTEFSQMGANTFTIRNKASRIGKSGQRPKTYRSISYREALEFKDQYSYPSQVAVSTRATFDATLKYRNKKTNPNVSVFGGDENYLVTSGYQLERGRNMAPQEITGNAHVVILGKEIVEKLFEEHENPIDQIIAIGSGKYKVIGVLKEKGSSMGFGGDRNAIVPLSNIRQYFSRPGMSFVINVITSGPQYLEPAISQATGEFRVIRKVPVKEENNFDVLRSDNLAMVLIENISYVTMAAVIIGMITLFGAAIGLMNIMLVSVTERTREIGTRKAIGATEDTIKWQFLAEAVVICQIGGVMGIVFGILTGNLVSLFIGSHFVIPWPWVIAGIILCYLVGIAAGYYPALKAARLDPIEALRHE